MDGAIIAYAPEFFGVYSPVTALDMVSQVPGFGIDNGQPVRGLADTFANVLIDGERQSTKSESIHQILQRIPAASVERVELVREAVPGIDMRGQTRVVNVVLAADVEDSTTIEGGLDYWVGSGRLTPAVDISRSWEMGETRFTLSGRYSENAAPLLRSERLEDAAGLLLETRDERTSRYRQDPGISASVSRRFQDGSRLDLSLNAEAGMSTDLDRSIVHDGAGALDRIELFQSEYDGLEWETVLTYERPLNDQWSAQLVFLNNQEEESADDRFTYAPANGASELTTFDLDVDSGERALRGTVSGQINERHSIEIGAETAFNYLDNQLEIFEDTGSGLQPVPLPVANTRVEEERSEVFVSHLWQPSDSVTIESGFRFERSTTTQSGDASRERSFNYPKPSVTLTWQADEQTQWTFSVNRWVGQLSFGQFASEVDATDDRVLIGNPELEPGKAWQATASWERRWGEDGSLQVSLVHERHDDVEDFRPVTVIVDDTVTPHLTRTFDAPGNIGEGERTYLQVNAAIPLDDWGIQGGRLDLYGMLRDSQVTDPTTGEIRRFRGNEDWRFTAEFQQNLPQHDFAWGATYSLLGDEDVFRYSQGFLHTRDDPMVDVFVETTAINGMTIRLTYGDALPQVRGRERTYYDGSRANGIVLAREFQEMDLGGYVTLRARATF